MGQVTRHSWDMTQEDIKIEGKVKQRTTNLDIEERLWLHYLLSHLGKTIHEVMSREKEKVTWILRFKSTNIDDWIYNHRYNIVL